MRVFGGWVVAVLLIHEAGAADLGRGRADRAADARDARALAARIDAKLAAFWAEAKVKSAPRADDGEFLRRACLDLIGRIPTAAEARDFLDDPNPEKRVALVDRLLDSPAYAARATALWRQILLPETEDQVARRRRGFKAWLQKKVAEEAGYDRVVREILTAKLVGRENTMVATVRTDPSPAAFYTAKGGKPETLASDAARAFLGLRLECAQCHDHPFAKWKKQEFWGFAAFFAGVPQAADDGSGTMPRNDANRRELTIPGTKTVVKASHLDHTAPAWRPRADTREVLADWVTSPSNPYFARAAVNRVWARFFGSGLIEPVDDIDSADDAELGGLLDEIAVEFRNHGYDMKYLVRALTATRAYSLTSAADANESSAPPPFARMAVRGLSPAQFLDSLAQSDRAPDISPRPGGPLPRTLRRPR